MAHCRIELTHLAPTLGQHNREIPGGLLGLSDREIEELASSGVIGSVATSKNSRPEPAGV
jgi:crotonobetainyl-CoA:carnitine CoA-transferase CaiB-like acyl-CoA transferase